MSSEIVLRIKPYIQPFERVLAISELQGLTGCTPILLDEADPANGTLYSVSRLADHRALLDRLSYWEGLVRPEFVATTQLKREASTNAIRNGESINELRAQLPFADLPAIRRRVLRYATHGIHEYRGKFFPQLVRALLNTAGVREGGLVADPMVGSGTTLVEAALSHCSGVGLDLNPLSVFIANTKCSLLTVTPHVLEREYEALADTVAKESAARRGSRMPYLDTLPRGDLSYLERWFSEASLRVLDQIMCRVNEVEDRRVRDLARVSVSNILRTVSWQKTDDLRVRREISEDELDPRQAFLAEFKRATNLVAAFLLQNGTERAGTAQASEGDAREIEDLWPDQLESADVVITSPPYATALPYVDTDRLSLSFLRLLPRSAQRRRDAVMVGNREVTEGTRREYWERFERERTSQPVGVVNLIDTINHLNSSHGAGFRRRNLPALLAKYFFDMRRVLGGIHAVLKPGAAAFVVIGSNHTVAGGERISIETPRHLAEIAQQEGFVVHGRLQMEMLTSRDIFRRNAIDSEEILWLVKPQ